MKLFGFSYQNTSRISDDELQTIAQQLSPEIGRIKQARLDGYKTVYASIHLPADSDMYKKIIELAQSKRMLKPAALVVIGIGGSNLGTIAIHEALFGRFYNEQQPEIKVYWADTVDSDYILDIILLLEQELAAGKEILLNVVSKSGTTTETIANFEIFLDLLKRNRPHTYHDFVVITTDEGSPLWKRAESEHFDRLEIPQRVGGRYSVFSAVGLFPLSLLGVDIKALAEGAKKMVDNCCNYDIVKNPAALSAALLYACYHKNISIHDMFLFSNDLQSLGMWYRQLLAESIGKENNIGGRVVHIGITPTVSIGSTDCHSMVELHLGGPNNTFTTFVSIEKNKSNIPVPCLEKSEQLIAHIECKPLSSIMNAILQGVQQAYEEKKRPFVSISIPEKSALHLGQFMQMNMVAVMYLGYLLQVNPFDQPAVELYKLKTRKNLAHE